MRKIIILILALIISCTALAETASQSEPTLEELLEQKAQLEVAIAQAEEDEIVDQSIEHLLEYWGSEIYTSQNESKDGYLGIKWTRVVYIKDDVEEEPFSDLNCYVEFFVLSDYFGSAPYYSHTGLYEFVAFHKDGTFEVLKTDPLNLYRTQTFSNDFSGIIESISDREADFNCEHYLLIE